MNLGDMVSLAKGAYPVVACEKCGTLMVDVAREDLGLGDLLKVKINGLTMGDPSTKRVWCISCEVNHQPSVRRQIKEYFDDPSPSSDSHFWGGFGGGSSSSSSSGSDSGSGFGGFGGFGGGGFSGGGASGGF